MLTAAAQDRRPAPAPRFTSSIRSPLPGVSDAAWERFRVALAVQPPGATSESGGFGSYDMRPRRLADLGYVGDLRCERTKSGRQVYRCTFLSPWTEERFLRDIVAQHQTLAMSMKLYCLDLRCGKIQQPEGMSLAGALAILHIGGKGALRKWPHLFENTRARYEAARGAF